MLLEDLALIIYAMLYGVTLPTNKDEMLGQYLVRRQRSFSFTYRIKHQSSEQRRFVRISRGDRFALSLGDAGSDTREGEWQSERFDGPACVKLVGEKRTGLVRLDCIRVGDCVDFVFLERWDD